MMDNVTTAATKIATNEINADAFLQLQSTLLSHTDFKVALAAFATDLALKLGFTTVSIGFLDQKHTTIAAVSHTNQQEISHEVSRLLIAALNESAEQNTVILYPEALDKTPRIVLAHAALSQENNHQICTIPLTSTSNNSELQVFAGIIFERERSKIITNDELATLKKITHLISPILALMQKQNHSLRYRIGQKLWSSSESQPNPNKNIKLLAYGLPLALLALSFIPVDYNVSAPARVEGLIQRTLVAPEDGFLQQTYVQAGDKVIANQLLAELADKDLKLGKARWESELAQYENAYGTALARSDRVQMMINQSKIEEIKSQLGLVAQNIDRSKITAPFDGIIIKGDLKQSLGAPVQRGDVLLTIAPAGQFRLIVEVDERDIALVSPQQTGSVVLVSASDKTFPFKVQNITPVATTKEGRHFFAVVADIADNANHPTLRPGQEGVAKIKAGKHSLIWILTHRMMDWLRITLWSWGL